ncbi:aminodeoxychorismate synthase component I [Ideonella sp. 4Y11]|uniref:Aminodeoxychorismate synthase component I n=1 Tax=Ideonella aquatica TaxID=2824119 RepID=A0A940YQI8_9BURK|nr:aminodeoxychorismate synthase component I [Ideonella aquatica]MBQ0960676.1 aminodeoxychorismate synthase component I [Ideonella aquatica]
MTGADPDTGAVVALLDDGQPGALSRLYSGFSHERRCTDPAALDACWAAVAADQARGLHAVLLADYEWGARLLRAGLPADPGASLRVLLFRQLRQLDEAGVQAWLQDQDGGAEQPTPAGAMDLQASVDEAGFTQAIDAVQAAIRDGETYQVNYTYRLHGRAHGHPAALYRRLRARQSVSFGAYIVLPPDERPDTPTHILSRSPELFLRLAQGLVTARPMKGTAARLRVPESDSEAARLLQQDVKNRAENLMIVDLLRNDLGRIAQVGSVQVPSLFAVEPYATVFQMTSTVQARLRPGIDMPALLRATFPCGSITGAPKLHTMDLIRRFESTPRGLYCGAIGWVDAPQPGAAYSSIGDFCLSVAIRTLTLGTPDAQGARPLRLGVGAGIVQDSVAADEFEECRLKARFLTALDPGFELFETMRVAPGQTPRVCELPRHLARLQRSAQALGFAFDAAAVTAVLQATLAEITASTAPAPLGWRLRLALRSEGQLLVRHAPLSPLTTHADGHVRVGWAEAPLLPDALSAHKTTQRAHYDAAVARAESNGQFDQLFCTPDGHVIEGGRSSVFALIDNVWVTPPLDDGALPGVCRGQLLAEGFEGRPVREARLTREALADAPAVMVGNALRGPLRALLV